jgi:C1A family cysteine protease
MAGKHKYGLIPDDVDERDYMYGRIFAVGAVPKSVDLRLMQSPVKNQGQTPACVGFSSASMKDYQEGLEHKRLFDFDGGWVYDECKKIDGYSGEGTQIRYAMRVLADEGCQEVGGAVEKKYCVKNYARISTKPEMKHALATSGAFVIGVDVYQSFEDTADGVIPVPGPDDQYLGGHAICVVGYDDTKKWFIVKNSWGPDWGDKGYCYLPYNFIDGYARDMWIAVDAQETLEA